MNIFYKFTCSLYMLLLIYSCASYSTQDNELPIVLSKSEQALTSLAESISLTENSDLLNAYNNLEKISKELFPALEKCNQKYRLTPAYMITLREAQKTLEHLHKDFNTMSDKAFLMEAIYLDYDAKLQSIRSSDKSDANTKIKVVVDSNEDEGYFVFGKLSYEQELDIKRFRFNKPTHNATQDFVPGYYLFWLEKEDRVGEPELHLIMSSGTELEKQLVLKTPK